jgi:DMSO reductase anchor subunit
MGYSFFALFDHPIATMLQTAAALLALVGIIAGGYYMYKLYRIPARPYWDHWHTAAAFIGAALSLSSPLIALIALSFSSLNGGLAQLLAGVTVLGLVLEGIGLLAHARDLKPAESEGAASFYEQTTTYGYAYHLRNGLLISGVILASSFVIFSQNHAFGFILLAMMVLISAVIGRSLFYVVVIPTTMPGGFFWKNKGFIDHARDIGLADRPEMGVKYEKHHKFDIKALWATVMGRE